MSTLAIETARNEARGDKRVAKLSGEVRSLEVLTLEKGDVLVIPDKIEAYEQKIGTDGKAQYIFVTIDSTDNVKPFYPSVFTKRRTVYNEDGTATTERVYTTGTAAELFRQYATVAEGMDALRGKKIKVTDIINVRTLRYGSDQLMTAQIPVIDLVEE